MDRSYHCAFDSSESSVEWHPGMHFSSTGRHYYYSPSIITSMFKDDVDPETMHQQLRKLLYRQDVVTLCANFAQASQVYQPSLDLLRRMAKAVLPAETKLDEIHEIQFEAGPLHQAFSTLLSLCLSSTSPSSFNALRLLCHFCTLVLSSPAAPLSTFQPFCLGPRLKPWPDSDTAQASF
jgi:hypothetical protein